MSQLVGGSCHEDAPREARPLEANPDLRPLEAIVDVEVRPPEALSLSQFSQQPAQSALVAAAPAEGCGGIARDLDQGRRPFQGKGGANAKVSKSVAVVGNKGKKSPIPVVEDVDTVNMSVTI